MNIEGKTALVTGASRGLGRAIAIALANAGANVAVNYRVQKEKADSVVQEIKKLGLRSEAIQADVSIESDVIKLASFMGDKFGGLDILVNNAGAIPRPGNWDLLKDVELNYTLDVNLKSIIYCMQQFVPLMVAKKQGRIINITSTYALTGASAVLAYTAAKAGIIPLTYGMARDLGKDGITVNAIAPGNFATDLAVEGGEGYQEWAKSTTPLGRLGYPEEIGEAVVFLAKADFITGHVLVVDGGHLLNM